jgi:hypothetical protein
MVKSLFVQLVRVQHVVPPVPEKLGAVLLGLANFPAM